MTTERDDSGDPSSSRVEELVGVYHAEGTVVGELTYWINARLGRAHCELCDITHGSLREKAEWRSCREALPVPFRTVHLDERSSEMVSATEGRTPCVVAVTGDGIRMLLESSDLERCDGSPSRLVEAVHDAADRLGLPLAP